MVDSFVVHSIDVDFLLTHGGDDMGGTILRHGEEDARELVIGEGLNLLETSISICSEHFFGETTS